jgi:hypothetical protein
MHDLSDVGHSRHTSGGVDLNFDLVIDRPSEAHVARSAGIDNAVFGEHAGQLEGAIVHSDSVAALQLASRDSGHWTLTADMLP